MQLAPLEELPPEMQEWIRCLAVQVEPPPKWINVGPIWIESRAWVEWQWAHGRKVCRSDRRVALPARVRAFVAQRDEMVCQLCGGEIEPSELNIDHKVPVALGGGDEVENLQATHAWCNRSKGARV